MRRKLQDLVRRCNQIVDPIIYDHISKKKQGKEEDCEDLVDVLLTFHRDKDEPSYDSQFSLAIDNIKAIVLVSGSGTKILLLNMSNCDRTLGNFLEKNFRWSSSSQVDFKISLPFSSIDFSKLINKLSECSKYLALEVRLVRQHWTGQCVNC